MLFRRDSMILRNVPSARTASIGRQVPPTGNAPRPRRRLPSVRVLITLIVVVPIVVASVTLIAIYLMRSPSLGQKPIDWTVLAFIPAALLGAWFGLHIFRRLSDRQFEIAVNVLLIASGVSLVL